MVAEPEHAIDGWLAIVGIVRARVAGLSDAQLDERRDGEPMSLRELVHHVAEANVVAAGIVIAALGSPGCVFDWSWMMPFGPWLDRMDYRRKPIGPSLQMIEALNEYVVAQVEPLPDGLQRPVLLRDTPDGEPRRATVGDVMLQEVAHVREHFGQPAT